MAATLRIGSRHVPVACDAGTLTIDGLAEPVVVAGNGERDLHATLAALARNHGLDVRACGSCQEFRFSGMSYQMSGGAAGYCSLVAFRAPRLGVSILHGCGEHTRADGWPGDLDRVGEERVARYRSARPSRLAAFTGAMLGLAVGDALGYPAEFRTREQILATFPPRGLSDFVAHKDPRWPERPIILGADHPPGTYSDDTQMTLAVAEALLAAGKDAAIDVAMQHMAGTFVAWSRSDDNNRAPGNACMTGCQNLARGVSWREAGVADSKGCGSAMRVAPIGLLYHRDHDRLLEVARAQSVLTHRHDAGIEGAAAAALLVALALEKRAPREMYDAIMDTCAPRSADFRACLEKLPGLLDADPAVALSEDGLGEAWVAEEAVASALYCFWRSPDDFAETVLTATNTDGDSDSIACIAGSISGAFNGAAAIPERWREEVENQGGLVDVATRLWNAASLAPPAPQA